MGGAGWQWKDRNVSRCRLDEYVGVYEDIHETFDVQVPGSSTFLTHTVVLTFSHLRIGVEESI